MASTNPEIANELLTGAMKLRDFLADLRNQIESCLFGDGQEFEYKYYDFQTWIRKGFLETISLAERVGWNAQAGTLLNILEARSRTGDLVTEIPDIYENPIDDSVNDLIKVVDRLIKTLSSGVSLSLSSEKSVLSGVAVSTEVEELENPSISILPIDSLTRTERLAYQAYKVVNERAGNNLTPTEAYEAIKELPDELIDGYEPVSKDALEKAYRRARKKMGEVNSKIKKLNTVGRSIVSATELERSDKNRTF